MLCLDVFAPDNLAVAGDFSFHQAYKHGFVVSGIDPVKEGFFSFRRIFIAFFRVTENEFGFSGGNKQVIQHSLNILILRAADQCLSAILQSETDVLNNHEKASSHNISGFFLFAFSQSRRHNLPGRPERAQMKTGDLSDKRNK